MLFLLLFFSFFAKYADYWPVTKKKKTKQQKATLETKY